MNSGWLRLWAGDPDVAIKHFETGIRLNPRAPSGGASLGIGIAHFFARRFREAEAALLRSLQLMPGWVGPYRWLAACYAHMGRLDEARDVVRRLGAIAPCGRVTATRYRNAEHRELYLAGLRLAMDEAS